jgi:hypothetical protein
MPISPRVAATLAMALALVCAGCGGDGGSSTSAGDTAAASVPGGADPGDVQVIDAWARALARGDIEAAARYFALPSTTENGIPLDIQSPDDARRFNRSLPCGARLVHASTRGDLTIATFRLIERPGPGTCGSGVGAKAATAFAIDHGKIADWRRVPVPGANGGTRAPSQTT